MTELQTEPEEEEEESAESRMNLDVYQWLAPKLTLQHYFGVNMWTNQSGTTSLAISPVLLLMKTHF